MITTLFNICDGSSSSCGKYIKIAKKKNTRQNVTWQLISKSQLVWLFFAVCKEINENRKLNKEPEMTEDLLRWNEMKLNSPPPVEVYYEPR